MSVCSFGTTWICVCNGYNTKGIPVVLGFYDGGAGWVAWPQHPGGYGHWQVAGGRPGPEGAPDCRVYAYLWGTEYDAAGSGWNSLACQQVEVTPGGVFTGWGTRAVVDRVRFGEGGGAYLFALQERATAAYWFVAALYALPGNMDMEEPVFLAPAEAGAATCEFLQPLAAGRRAWLIGAGEVWASAQTDTALDGDPVDRLAERSYTPTTYRYDVSSAGGGVLQLELARAASTQPAAAPAAGAALEGFGAVYPPEIYVGDMLWLDRTLRVGAAAGTLSLAFRVAAVAYRRGTIEVLALDALGVLAHMRPRRAKVLMKGDRLRMARCSLRRRGRR